MCCRGHRKVRAARKESLPTPAKLSESHQPLDVVGTSPHSEPAITLRAEPLPRPRRRLYAVGGLELAGVKPSLQHQAQLGDEAGTWVAWLGHRAHGATVSALCSRPDTHHAKGRAGDLHFKDRGRTQILCSERWYWDICHPDCESSRGSCS